MEEDPEVTGSSRRGGREAGVGRGYWEPEKSVSKEPWSTESKAVADPPEAPFVFRTVWWLGPWKEQSVENVGPERLLWARREWEQEVAAGPFPYDEVLE